MNYETWPQLMRQLAELVGPALTLRIVERWGGLANVRIPADPTTPHPWQELVEADDWARIVAHLGGQRVDVPRGTHLRLRKTLVLELCERHPELSDGELALRAGCTQRYVRSLRGGRRQREGDPRQMALFRD